MTLSEVYWYPTSIHGDILRLPSHRAIQYLVNPRHEEGRWQALHQLVAADAVVFDIGAEQGELSALLASWTPKGGVVLVEPNADAWPTVAAIFTENDLSDRVLGSYEGFVGSEGTDTAGWVAHGFPPAASGTLNPAAGMAQLAEQAADYPTITVDALCDLAGSIPDVLNIDVEGAELQVLLGAERTLTDHRPIIAVSVHPTFLAHWWDTDTNAVLGHLEARGYRCHLVHSDHELHFVCLP